MQQQQSPSQAANTAEEVTQGCERKAAVTSRVSAEKSGAVVGPTPAELESINELIKFDHVYYKVEPSCQGAVSIITKPATSLLANKSLLNKKYSKKVSSIIIIDDHDAGLNFTPEENNSASVETRDENTGVECSPSTDMDVCNSFSCSDAISEVMDLDASAEEQLLDDLASILQEDIVGLSGVNPLDVVSQEETIAKSDTDTFISNSQVQTLKRKFSDSDCPIFSDLDITSSFMDDTFRIASSTDSGFSSDYSDASSPRSEMSSSLDDTWQDSFTELFPDLI